MANDNSDPVFKASRKALLAEYEKNNIQFTATTRPYKSTQTFEFVVVNTIGAIAHAVLRAQTVTEWFSYGRGDQIPIGAGLFGTATDAETNLSKGRRTNGVEDFIIEGISATRKCVRVRYASADVPVLAVDTDVRNAYLGTVCLVDPAAIIMPPQGFSPFNLEDLLFEALKPNLAIEFVWDRRNFIPIGTLDQIPEGGAKSLLRASGDPRTDNRYKVPEGYVWRRADKPDGDFAVRGTVADPLVVPINLVTLPAAQAAATPTHIFIDVAIRLHGLGLNQPGQNVG